jgi:sialate O-acetylesterase
LADSYQVANLGYSGATLLKNGRKPYKDKPAFKESQDFEPNFVIIHLGLNDQGNNNWPK